MQTHSWRPAFAIAFVGVAVLAGTMTPGAIARSHRANVPSTGLSGLAFDRSPPDLSFDAGDGMRPLHTRFGKPLVINFWATWCGPCLDELSQFSQARAIYRDRISIVTISAEPNAVVTAFLTARGLPLPVVISGGTALAKAFGVGEIPVTVLLDAEGRVAHVSVGELDPGELATALTALMPSPVQTLTPTPGSGTLRPMPGTPSE